MKPYLLICNPLQVQNSRSKLEYIEGDTFTATCMDNLKDKIGFEVEVYPMDQFTLDINDEVLDFNTIMEDRFVGYILVDWSK